MICPRGPRTEPPVTRVAFRGHRVVSPSRPAVTMGTGDVEEVAVEVTTTVDMVIVIVVMVIVVEIALEVEAIVVVTASVEAIASVEVIEVEIASEVVIEVVIVSEEVIAAETALEVEAIALAGASSPAVSPRANVHVSISSLVPPKQSPKRWSNSMSTNSRRTNPSQQKRSLASARCVSLPLSTRGQLPSRAIGVRYVGGPSSKLSTQVVSHTVQRPVRRQERGPPPVRNSRFAALADEEREIKDNRGPPPVANSRFAAAAARNAEEEQEREQRRQERFGDRFGREDEGGRFGREEGGRFGREEGGRFGREEGGRFGREEGGRFGRDEGGRFGRDDRRGPPPVANSRFAAAAAADEDYVDRDERMFRQQEREQERMSRQQDREQYGGRYEDRGGRYEDRGGRYEDRGGRYEERGGFRGEDRYEGPPPEEKSRVDDLLKPKAPPKLDNMLVMPKKLAPEQEANMLQFPAKPLSKDKEEDVLSPPKKEPEPVKEPEPEVAVPLPTDVDQDALIAEFCGGKLLGDELSTWCAEKKPVLPPVHKLVYEMLMEREKLNPDPECAWAEPTNYGAALLSMVEDDIVGQMQVLWGIQFYCDKLGFPKFNDEAIVQSMFRSMYKYDLAGDDAFAEWKEDESTEFEKGKMNAVIQTVDWFNWLEEEDEEEEDEEY